MKIAVIGGGIFGGTTAIKLAEAGFKVDLYEKNPDLLMSASGINQYRLHRGYHYPRSLDTATSANLAEPIFRKEYGEAVVETAGNYYALAKEGSKVNLKEFSEFCESCGLEYEISNLPIINPESVEGVVKVRESIIDPLKLREIVNCKLKERGVNVFLNTEFKESFLDRYDLVVNATYANLNFLFKDRKDFQREYQFEVCEKIVLKLPQQFKNLSVVVVDGPFFCIDPYADSGLHVMGNVVHAIHKTNNGLFPDIPEEFKGLLNRGIIKNPPITNFEKFIESATFFMPEIRDAEHVGSMYTVRTVLPRVEKTDERPTLVYKVNDKLINIFSGKIGNSVQAGIDTVEMVKKIQATL